MADKKAIRARMKELEKEFLASGRAEEETALIWKSVASDDAFIKAGTVLIYMDIRGEVPTGSFMEQWKGSKRFAIPRVNGERLDLCIYDPSRLREGYRQIPEPSDDAECIDPSEVDFALIPGVAFTREGARLGRGKGFYDRLLPCLNCPCSGIGYSFRWIDGIPCDPWDFPLNHLIWPWNCQGNQ